MNQRKWMWLAVLVLSVGGSCPAVAESFEWIRIGSFVCRRVSPTIVMRDPGTCSASAVFCNTPVNCHGPAGSQSIATVMCRANRGQAAPPVTCGTGFCGVGAEPKTAAASVGILPPQLSCPSLQRCADDPNPQLGFESDLLRWSGFSDNEISLISRSSSTAAFQSHR